MTHYAKAQEGVTLIKSAVYEYLLEAGETGATNAQIGRALGIYKGHARHDGHIPRTLLATLESEGMVKQDPETKIWTVTI